MLKKIAQVLFSTRLSILLFLIFAAAMAAGTFLDASEATSPSAYTNRLIYQARWFELVMLLLVINFSGNIRKYRLYRKEKWATLLLHLAFIVIFIGAFITRYIGYEGVMHIREGESTSKLLSSDVYLTGYIEKGGQKQAIPSQKLLLSERLSNDLELVTTFQGQPVTIKIDDFVSNAEEVFVENPAKPFFLKVVEAKNGFRADHWLADGGQLHLNDQIITLNNPVEGALNLKTSNYSEFTLSTPVKGSVFRMSDQKTSLILSDSIQPLFLRSLYQIGNTSFVIPEGGVKGEYKVAKAPMGRPTGFDGLTLQIKTNNQMESVSLLGGKGTSSNFKQVNIAGLNISLAFGSEIYSLPFNIRLNDFIADKYPGTEKAYAAFKSKVTVFDPEAPAFHYDIFMNNVLNYKGYRFFQSAFDPDERGTILSVNHDFWGTWITYIGYFALYAGLIGILFSRNTRVSHLKHRIKKLKKRRAALVMVLGFLSCFQAFSQDNKAQLLTTADSLIRATNVSKEHSAIFGQLVIQDNGRMKPVNTYASELLRKVSRKSTYKTLDADQAFLSMQRFPRLWFEIPIIYLKRGNDSIRNVIGVPSQTGYISMSDLFDESGQYVLAPHLEGATQTANPNKFQKDIIKLHQSFYLLNETLGGITLKVFPLYNDPNNKWISPTEIRKANFKGVDSLYTHNILPLYLNKLNEASSTNDYTQANELLYSIADFQAKYAGSIMPGKQKVNAEILYNKLDIFNRLYRYFSLLGILLLILSISQIFSDKKLLGYMNSFVKALIVLLFFTMTFGLILRWYVSGHAPWSNAYESIIYVGWATMFFGLILGKKNDLAFAGTTFVAAIVLWVAHENWVDPAISNLQPVLNSYWLMIHVAIIVASYGPFTLSMILGVISLFLILFTNLKNQSRIKLHIDELQAITEIAMTVGLVMLTIGNFLGGQWANESWGRYWGWDPKETWALISIMIYAMVLHLRLVPALRSKWLFNLMSVIAYSSILMTYFGVNFYLVGLHSYASGDSLVTPDFVWYSLVSVILLGSASYMKFSKYFKPTKLPLHL